MSEALGVDGAVMAVVGDLVKDQDIEKEYQFRLALQENGDPLYKRGIRALNTRGAGISENGVAVSRDDVNRFLFDNHGKTLALGIGAEDFLRALALYGESRIDLLKKYQKSILNS